jgi:glycosyltransferase involved in cell wall biosynthesis
MRVTLDARLVGYPGIGRFIEGLWRGLLEIGADVVGIWPAGPPRDWLGLHRFEPPGPHVTVRTRPFRPNEQVMIPRHLHKIGADAHHAMFFNVPYAGKVPVVLTVHDLFPYLDRSNARSRAAGLYYRAVVPLAIRRAKVVATVSPFTARQLRESFGVLRQPVHVIEHGLDHDRWHRPPTDAIDAVRARFRIPSEYLLYVGTAKRHKNLSRLIAAHRKHHPPLVLAGPAAAELPVHLEGAPGNGSVIALGRVPDDVLPGLYAGALALVLPSFYEAVGFTALEAMACGTPIVASDGGGLPDTVGDAGILVRVGDVVAWSQALTTVAEDASLRDRLRSAGRARVATRSWRACAHQYLELYQQAVLT